MRCYSIATSSRRVRLSWVPDLLKVIEETANHGHNPTNAPTPAIIGPPIRYTNFEGSGMADHYSLSHRFTLLNSLVLMLALKHPRAPAPTNLLLRVQPCPRLRPIPGDEESDNVLQG